MLPTKGSLAFAQDLSEVSGVHRSYEARFRMIRFEGVWRSDIPCGNLKNSFVAPFGRKSSHLFCVWFQKHLYKNQQKKHDKLHPISNFKTCNSLYIILIAETSPPFKKKQKNLPFLIAHPLSPWPRPSDFVVARSSSTPCLSENVGWPSPYWFIRICKDSLLTYLFGVFLLFWP